MNNQWLKLVHKPCEVKFVRQIHVVNLFNNIYDFKIGSENFAWLNKFKIDENWTFRVESEDPSGGCTITYDLVTDVNFAAFSAELRVLIPD